MAGTLVVPVSLRICPKFDFLSFFHSKQFTDCELKFYESDAAEPSVRIKAHRAILATSSEFWKSAFTATMQEAQTGEIEIRGADLPVGYAEFAEKLVQFAYTGELRLDSSCVMRAAAVASYLGMVNLEKQIWAEVRKRDSSEEVFEFVDECYSCELPDQLKELVPHIAAVYSTGKLSIANLSTNLDVVTFVEVLKLTTVTPAPRPEDKGKERKPSEPTGRPLNDKEKYTRLVEFLGEWRKYDDDKDTLAAKTAIADLFQGAPAIKQSLRAAGYLTH
jgi:hypothetical protein